MTSKIELYVYKKEDVPSLVAKQSQPHEMEAVKDTPKLYRLRMYFDVVLVRLFGNTNIGKVSDFANIAGIFFTLYILFLT